MSFSVRPGEIVSVIGPNGAGKTTLFNMISGIYIPSSGSVKLDGQDVTGWDPFLLARRGLSRTFQNLQIFQTMTVLENAIAGFHLQEKGPLLADLLHLPSMKARAKAAEAEAPRPPRPRPPRQRRREGGELALLRRAQATGDRPRAGA